MKPYTVEYKMHQAGEVKKIVVLANDKADAWRRANFEEIAKKESSHPYSSWVAAVTYNNGNYKTFNTFEGKPY